MIGGFEVVIRNATAGDRHTETVVKVRPTDRAKYVQMAAQHFALLTDVVRIEHDAERIQLLYAGRVRAAAAGKALTAKSPLKRSDPRPVESTGSNNGPNHLPE